MTVFFSFDKLEKLKKFWQKAVLIYRMKRSYIIKSLLGLALVLLIYFIGIQGCSPTLYLGGLETVSCDEFPERFGCNVERVLGPPPTDDEDDDEEEDEDGKPRSPREPRRNYLSFEYVVPSGKVDIIFVIDNSSSMAKEHRSLSGQFISFLHNLKHVDYHIAVITTDISSSPKNPVRGAYYQDGKFIPIGRRIFLRNENQGQRIPEKTIRDFQNAVVREETRECDTSNQPRKNHKYDFGETDSSIECPSHDERGTYALNLAIKNPTHQAFFRADAHLMMVILSDEDVRSGEDYINQPGFEDYALEDLDYPEVLVENIYNRFGPLKSFSVYPIIIPPGDRSCLNKQNARGGRGEGTGRGYYGREYAMLADAPPELQEYGNLLEGDVISICRKSYGSQLNRVALAANTVRIPLPCGDPDRIETYIDGQRQRFGKRIEGRTLVLEPGNIRLGADIVVRVRCIE